MTDPRQELEEVFKVIHPEPFTSAVFKRTRHPDDATHALDGLFPEWDMWNSARNHFRRFLDAEAWTDAALMLIGPDRWLEFKGPRKYLNIPTPVPAAWSANIARWNHDGDVTGWGDTLAEAIAQACLKAKEQSDA